jgi:ABC-type transport system substrate-binding protein
MHRKLPFLVLASTLVCLVTSCGGAPQFSVDDDQSWADMCPSDYESSRHLVVRSECHQRIVTQTAEAACALDDPLGCALAGAWYGYDESPMVDRSRGIELSEWACEEMGDPFGCFVLAVLLFEGDIYEKGRAYNLMRHTCLDGMALSCHGIGRWYRHQPDGAKERQLAAGFFKRSCDHGFAAGCREFAQVYEEGFGVRQDDERAAELYNQACDMGDREACLEVDRDPPHNKEEMWLEDLGITNEQYLGLYSTACDNGFKHACTRGGHIVQSGSIGGRYIARNIDRAAEFYERGCAQGAPLSCWAQARVVRYGAKALGRGSLEPDTAKAAALAKKACDMGLERGCDQYRDYRYRLFDESEAEEFASRCEEGDAEACYLSSRALAHLSARVFAARENARRCESGNKQACYMAAAAPATVKENNPETRRALTLIERGCQLGYAPACEYAGIYYAEGIGTEVDEARAVERYESACEGGTGYACRALAKAYLLGKGVEEDTTRGLELAELACERYEGEACMLAGRRHYKGEGVDVDMEKAREFYSEGCMWRYVSACTQLGTMMRRGEGGEEDPQAARYYLQRSCSNDDGRACFELAQMYEEGEGGEEILDDSTDDDSADPIEAADHYEKACLADYAAGCAELARMYDEGIGVRQDPGRAQILRQQACSDGHEDACEESLEPAVSDESAAVGRAASASRQADSSERVTDKCASQLRDPDNILEPPSEPRIPANAQQGGRLRRSSGSTPKGFNWVTENGADVSELQTYAHNVFATRDHADPDKWVPELACKVEVNDDFTEYTIHLRDDVYWQRPNVDLSDDTFEWLRQRRELTAEDAAFYFELIKNPQVRAGAIKSYYDELDRVEVVDEYTLKVYWKKKVHQSLAFTLGVFPMPKWLYTRTKQGEEIPEASLGTEFNTHWAGRYSVGTGPYEITKVETDKRVVLERNEDYWGPRPPIDEIEYRVIENQQMGYKRFMSGYFDLTELPPSVYRSEVEEAETDIPFETGELNYAVVDRPAYFYLGWNADHVLFSDKRVRRAMTHALNRAKIIETVLSGLGKPLSGPFLPDHPANNPDVDMYEFDLDKARRLLDEAGWTDTDGDGVRDKMIDGEKVDFRFQMLTYNLPEARQYMSIFRDDLREIGVSMTVNPLGWAQMQREMDGREFAAFTGGWGLSWSIDPFQIWHSSQADVPKGSNRVGFRNERADEIIETLRVTFDEDRRLELLREFHTILHQEQPYTFFYQLRTAFAWQPHLHNVHFQKLRPQALSLPWWIEESAGD